MKTLAIALLLLVSSAQAATRYVDRPLPYPVGGTPCFVRFAGVNLNAHAIQEFGVIIDDRPIKSINALRVTMVTGRWRQVTEGDLFKQETELQQQIVACTSGKTAQPVSVARPLL